MNDYRKNDFLLNIDKDTKDKRFYIKVNNQMIEVSKDVFNTCYHSYRKDIRDGKRDSYYKLISYDVEFEDGYTLLETLGAQKDIIEELMLKEYYQQTMNIINDLDAKDKELMIDIFICGKKEKELAERYQVAQQAINKRKQRIIKKLLKISKNRLLKVKQNVL